MILKAGGPQTSLNPGHFLPIDLPLDTSGGCSNPVGGACYRWNIGHCNGNIIQIGDLLSLEPGNMIGPTQQGVGDLIAQDPGAVWVGGAGGGIMGSCAPGCAAISPRIVAIPMFDTEFYDAGTASGRIDIRIANILGFFVENMQGNTVVGRIMIIPGLLSGGGGAVSEASAFSRTTVLIR